jgi:hypothetical protein
MDIWVVLWSDLDICMDILISQNLGYLEFIKLIYIIIHLRQCPTLSF